MAQSVAIETVKRRLKRKKAWGLHLMEEMARNQAQVMVNRMANEKSDRAMVTFLLDAGFSEKEIVAEVLSVQNKIRKHFKQAGYR
jgi:hypothetical protein